MGARDLFYVYDLIDPRSGKVFYVGKGKGRRYQQHRAEAVSGKLSRKCDLIRSILSDGLEYEHRFVAFYQCEEVAYEAEAARIDSLGLGNLTNCVPGGGGLYGSSLGPTPEDEARAAISANAKALKTCLVLRAAGARIWLGQYDISDAVDVAIKRLRELAGEAVFAAKVGRATLLSVSAQGDYGAV